VNANSSPCTAEKLPICLLGLTRLHTCLERRGEMKMELAVRFDEFAAVYSQPFETSKKEAMINQVEDGILASWNFQ